MECQSLAHAGLRSFSTRSMKLPRDHMHAPNPLKSSSIQCSKRSPKSISDGLQKNAKKDLSRILRTNAAVKGIVRKANSRKYTQLWPKAILEALDEAISDNQWETALKIFGLLRQQHWYEARCQTYTKLLMMLGKCRQPAQASLLFEIMLSEGLRPTIDVYTALVSSYGQCGLLDKALSTLEDMKSISHCKPDIYTYSILISSCTKFHRFELIGRIRAEMSYLGIECNTVTYNTIINGYGKAEMFKLMEDTLTEMIESESCLPDIFTLNTFVGAYGKLGQIEKMEKWYNEFQLMGIQPDMKTFNILIKSYGKAGMFEKMRLVMHYMEKRFFSPTIVTFNTVIEVFGKAGNIEKMDTYFQKMKHQGIKPNAITYCSLVSAYSKAGHMIKVDSILRQVENSDVKLDTPFYNCIISAYGQSGDVERMSELVLKMKERGCKPDNVTFATMIQAYNAQGMNEAAENLEKKRIVAEEKFGIMLCLLLSISAKIYPETSYFFYLSRKKLVSSFTSHYSLSITKPYSPLIQLFGREGGGLQLKQP